MSRVGPAEALQPGTRCMLRSMPWPGEAFDPLISDRFVTVVAGPIDQLHGINGPWYRVQPDWIYELERPDLFVKASTLESIYTPLRRDVEAAKRTSDLLFARVRRAG